MSAYIEAVFYECDLFIYSFHLGKIKDRAAERFYSPEKYWDCYYSEL